MDPTLGAATIAGGSELVESVLNRILSSGDRNRLRRFAQFAQRQIGQPVVAQGEQTNFRGALQRRAVDRANQYGGRIAQLHGGLDQPSAVGAIIDRLYSARNMIDADTMLKFKQMQLNKDLGYANLAAGAYGRLA